MSLAFGLLVEQNKILENVTLGSAQFVIFHFFLAFYKHQENNLQMNR